MLRRYRSFKKLVYAGAILFTTILIYATTSNIEHQPTSDDWKLPVRDDGRPPVDPALLEPLHRLPLGPFEDMDMNHTVVLDAPAGDFGAPAPAAPAPAAPAKAAPAPAALAPAVPVVPTPAAPALVAPAPVAPVAPALAAPVAPAPAALAPVAPVAPAAPAPAAPAPVAAPAPAAAAPAPAPAQPKPGKPLPDFAMIQTEMTKRLASAKEQCDKLQVPNTVNSDIYLLPKQNISFCKVPKAGSTYWEQVISFLNHDTLELSYLGFKSPFQISKYDIRYTSYFNLPRKHWQTPEDYAEIEKTYRVLFVRHPLERLWSAYIDKFWLLDYWTSIALTMKTKGIEEKCPKTVTFREFIDFSIPVFNENWAPVTEMCNPCTYKPHVIGHVETMRDDTFYTLKQMKQDWLFAEQDKLNREESQMLDVIVYNYQIHSIHWYSFYYKCFSKKDLATRLWDVFKKVGYFSSHAALPDMPDYNQTTIIKEMRTQIKKFSLGPTNGRLQQLKVMRRDFEGLPKPVMTKLLEKYAMDFEIFGYPTTIPTS